MAGKPDMTPAVSAVRNAQADRLTRLRTVLELTIEEAAEMAGLSRHQWSRMERALANIDAVPLARFVVQLGIPSEYVVTGGFAGLSDDLIRNLAEREALDKAVAEGRMAAVPDRAPRGRRRRKSTAHNAPEGIPTAAAAPSAATMTPQTTVLRKVS